MFMANHLIGFGGSTSAVAAVALTDSANNTTDLSTYTFSSRTIAPGKVVVTIGLSNNTVTVSTVTVAGNSASLILRQTVGGVSVEMWEVDISSGTTADVVVTCSGTSGRCFIQLYSLTNVAASTHHTNSAATTSTTLNIPANGVAIAAGHDSSGGVSTWSGLTEDVDDVAEAASSTSASDAFATQQTGLTVSASSADAIIAASWATG